MSRVERVYEATVNRDEFRRLMAQATELGLPDVGDLTDMEILGDQIGLPEELLTTAIDVSAQLELKRQAMAAHASQIVENSFFLALSPVAFAAAFGTEWYRLRGAPPGTREGDLLPSMV
jgi:LmbE family N-acetylglucosaminyl deacetylase